MNVKIDDIKEMANEMNTRITDATAQTILNEFNRVVMDRADDWETIIKELIQKYKTGLDTDFMYKWIREKSGK